MDVVQYLHGLVSPTLGDDGEGVADLLKQYYALSVCRLAQMPELSAQVDVAGLWGDDATALVRRLSRSFHLSESKVSSYLNRITPAMTAEIVSLSEGRPLEQILSMHGVGALYLPAWAGEFVSGQYVRHQQNVAQPTSSQPLQDTPSENASLLDSPDEMTDDMPDAPIQKPVTRPKQISPVAWGLGALALAGVVGVGVGAWQFYQSSKTQTPTAQVTTPNGELNPPRLLLTTGENGTLYGCLAEVGNEALQTQFVQILQKNFGQVSCIMDVDSAFGASMVGLERLESIIAMMKSEAFTSIEIIGNQIIVNHPKTDILNRMVGDIGLLAPQFQVSAIAPLDKSAIIQDSIAKATQALNALPETATPYQMVRAVNLQHLDFQGTTHLPETYHPSLTLFAERLLKSPTAKFIIASHTSRAGIDDKAGVSLTESQAQAVKDFLVSQGVPESQLVVKGVGSAFPIADDETEAGQFKNRRVEFLVHDEAMMAWLSEKTAGLNTPTSVPSERPQMVESAPYVPAPPSATSSEPMAVQGMPPVILPEPVRTADAPTPVPVNPPPAQVAPAPTPVAQAPQAPAMQSGAETAQTRVEAEMPSYPNAETSSAQSAIPKEVLELSETAIGSDGAVSGQSFEIRK